MNAWHSVKHYLNVCKCMYKEALFIQCFPVPCPVRRGSTPLGMCAVSSGSHVYLSFPGKNNRISIFRATVSLPCPGGGFRDVRNVGTRQFSVSGC